MDKLCKKCLKLKPMDEFYAHPQMGDGRLNKCKECTKADVRENYAAHIEYYRQYDRKRWDEMGRRGGYSPAAHSRAARAWAIRNPEKKRANNVLQKAIDSGKVKRPGLCSECRKPGRIEGHHEDYSKPLEVKWLCKKCHGKTWKKPRLKMKPRKKGGYVGMMQPTRAA